MPRAPICQMWVLIPPSDCSRRSCCTNHLLSASFAVWIFQHPKEKLWTWWFLKFKIRFWCSKKKKKKKSKIILLRISVSLRVKQETSEWPASKEDVNELSTEEDSHRCCRSFEIPPSERTSVCVIIVMFPTFSRLLKGSRSLRLRQICCISDYLNNRPCEHSRAADAKTEQRWDE